MQDEISTLAHKLRDLFDPAGLFVLVALNGMVQLVARSTSDAVDVATWGTFRRRRTRRAPRADPRRRRMTTNA
jgi:hypothetical protein